MAAALDVSVAVAHTLAANELLGKGRFARSAEQWGRAAEAARALGAPDCLVMAYTQARAACLVSRRVLRSAEALAACAAIPSRHAASVGALGTARARSRAATTRAPGAAAACDGAA